MKSVLTFGAASLAATSALAHGGGAHLHPHGAGTYLVALLTVSAGLIALKALRK